MRALLLLLIPLLSFAQSAEHLATPARHHCTLFLVLQAYKKTTLVDEQRFEIQNNRHEWTTAFNNGVWRLTVEVDAKKKKQYELQGRVQLVIE